MANSLVQRFRQAWSVFTSRSPTQPSGPGYALRQDRPRLRYGNDKTIIASIYNHISIDCRNIDIKHVRVDQNERFKKEITDSLDDCLRLNANIDQTGRDLLQDIVLTMLDDGVVGIFPTTADRNVEVSDKFNIHSLRCGKIKQWYPKEVRIELYNDNTGRKQEVIVPKSRCAIVQNPFYSIMNEPNSTARRLSRKLALIDAEDENSYGKLDLIIQLPYDLRSDLKRNQAVERSKDIEMQLLGSRYGVAYTGISEHVTQLNRSLNNNLITQANDLTDQLYAQLGMTKEVFNGTANEQTQLNYYNTTIEPIMLAICEEMTRKFLSKQARSKGHRIMFFRDPFKLVPVNSIAEIADKFTRNEILSSNEVRGLIGFAPVNDPDADALRNKNLNQTAGQTNPMVTDNSAGDTTVKPAANNMTPVDRFLSSI